MPRTDVTEDRPYQRFQGINLKDDSDRNEAHDVGNLIINREGLLTNVKGPSAITAGVTGTPKAAYRFVTKTGTEVEVDVDQVCAAPAVTEVTDDGSETTITGSNLRYVERVLLMRKRTVSAAEVVVSEIDFDITSRSAGSIVCDVSGGPLSGDRYTFCIVESPGGAAAYY
jgi:hypothetical protein